MRHGQSRGLSYVVVRKFLREVETGHTFLAPSHLAQHMLSVVLQDMPSVLIRFPRLSWCLHRLEAR
jgi:hypothetical protein